MRSLALGLVLLSVSALVAVTFASGRSVAAMSGAAGKWLASLSPEQKQKATFAFDSEERLRWHFVPNEMFPRNGVTIKEMSEPQRALAHDLLKTGLSARGYLAADKQAWGWRFEGHHLSIRFDIVGGSMTASSPTFFGSNPAEVREGSQKGLRVLGIEEDAGRALLDSLDEGQRKIAIVLPEAPPEMVTSNALKVDPLSPIGIKASALSNSQREKLTQLIDVYTGLMAPDIAAERMDRLRKAGLDNIAFAWAGETQKGKKHYYRLQGPTFLVEYDNAQNDGNHIHSVWREFDGDFGRDLLREHLKSVPH